MGNPDLIISINEHTYLIGGKDYNDKIQAIELAMKKFNEMLFEIEEFRHGENGELVEGADPDYWPEEIKVIRVFDI